MKNKYINHRPIFAKLYRVLLTSAIMMTAVAICVRVSCGFQPAGGLDPSFGVGGKMTAIREGDAAGNSIGILRDGKIIVGGYVQNGPNREMAVARLTAAGKLDQSFGDNGTTKSNFSGLASANSLAIQTDGRIVVAGFVSVGIVHQFALARFNSDGSLDSTFDGDGQLITQFGCYAEAKAVALEPDGKIIAGGFGCRADGVAVFAIARYKVDGSLDQTFGNGGRSIVDFGTSANANSITVQSNGRIVLAGQVGYSSFAIARINNDGSIDTSFGAGGRVTTRVGNSALAGDEAFAVAVQPDGKIVAAGGAGILITTEVSALVRYNTDGSLDSSFGNAGKVLGGDSIALGIAIQTNGKILAAGESDNGSDFGYDFGIARYTEDGSPDYSFGTFGMATTDFGSSEDFANAIALQSDGKIVVAGQGGVGSSYFAVARYFGDEPRSTKTRADFDGDGRTDLSVFRPPQGIWYLNRSQANIAVMSWGVATDEPVPADYDGDRKTDIAIFRPSSAGDTFYIVNSSGPTLSSFAWGEPGDIPVVADYDGDGKDDAAVFRPSECRWYIRGSRDGYIVTDFGQVGDRPVRGDFDGDGKNDMAVYHKGQWTIKLTGSGVSLYNWGVSTDMPVAADYDGDGRDELAVYRPSQGRWYIRSLATGTFTAVNFGEASDIPVPGDYDADGRADPAVYRNGLWYLHQSKDGFAVTTWGVTSDVPIPSKY